MFLHRTAISSLLIEFQDSTVWRLNESEIGAEARQILLAKEEDVRQRLVALRAERNSTSKQLFSLRSSNLNLPSILSTMFVR
jgi:hypothetical protein